MKLFNFRKKKNPETEQRSISDVYQPYSNVLTFGKSYKNTSAMCISAVYRATEIISDTIAILPIKVKVKNSEHKENLEGHSINIVFKNGINLINRYNFMKLLVQSVILKGNGYAYIERADDGTVTGLRFLESSDVTINYNKQLNKLDYTCTLVNKKRIDPKDMIHLVKNSYDGINGVSILTYAKRIIDISNNTEDSANSFFSNGCNLGGIITVQGNLTEQQKQDIRQNWNQAYNGSESSGCLLGVLQGNMSYQPIQLNATDSQMLESRQFNVQDIARFFGISPVLLGDLSHNSYSTIEAVQEQFLLQTLQPYITMIEEEFTKKLFKENESDLEINLDETVILRTNKTAQASYYSTLLDKGILSINEVRKELGYSEIEGGDAHTIAYTDINQNKIDNKEEKEEKVEDGTND